MSEKGYFNNIRDDLFPYIPADALSILDLGCGAGATIAALKKLKKDVFVAGVEIDREQRKKAEKVADLVLHIDLNMVGFRDRDFFKRALDRQFDVILMGDVLEHLTFPTTLLEALPDVMTDSGIVVASIPNIGWAGAVSEIAHQRMQYRRAGIFDAGHMRFYCRDDIRDLFEFCGFDVLKLETLHGTAGAPEYKENMDITIGEHFAGLKLTEDLFNQLMTYQWVCVAKPKGE